MHRQFATAVNGYEQHSWWMNTFQGLTLMDDVKMSSGNKLWITRNALYYELECTKLLRCVYFIGFLYFALAIVYAKKIFVIHSKEWCIFEMAWKRILNRSSS